MESDETFVGPNPIKMHKDPRVKLQAIRGQQRRGDMYVGKTAVHGLLDRETREVRCKVIPNVRRDTLQNEILNNIAHGSKLYTDEATCYMGIEKHFVHEVVQHATEYVRGQVHTNGLENFWRLFKRNLRGTYVCVEPFHLDRYLDDSFRFNNRGGKKPEERVNDADRFVTAMSRVIWQAPYLCPTDRQGCRRAPPSGGRDADRGRTLLARIFAGLSAAFRLRFFRGLFLWNRERVPHRVLELFPCFHALVVFCFPLRHSQIMRLSPSLRKLLNTLRLDTEKISSGVENVSGAQVAAGNQIATELRLLRASIQQLDRTVKDAAATQNQQQEQEPPILRAELQIPEAVETDKGRRDDRQYRVGVASVVVTALAFLAALLYGGVALRTMEGDDQRGRFR